MAHLPCDSLCFSVLRGRSDPLHISGTLVSGACDGLGRRGKASTMMRSVDFLYV